MKKLLLLFTTLFLIPILLFSQENKCDINTQFAQNAQFFFNSFQDGTVVFRDNSKTNALLNYNVVTDDIYFINDNKYFSLDRNDIKYVAICDYRFYFNNTKVFELVYSKNIKLLVQRNIDLEDLYDKKGAYGASSPNTVGVDLQYANLVPMSEDNSFIVNLRKENDKELDVISSFKIKKGNKFFPATKRTIFKIYKDQKDAIETYLDENNINFNKKDDLIKLLNYCASL